MIQIFPQTKSMRCQTTDKYSNALSIVDDNNSASRKTEKKSPTKSNSPQKIFKEDSSSKNKTENAGVKN